MQLDILTPEQKVFSGEVDHVQLPGMDGLFGLLNNHAPMIAALGEGKLSYKIGTTSTVLHIKSGIVEVLQNKIAVLTEGINN
jgi:F-type H+-transporting ATPase subunit epsilon